MIATGPVLSQGKPKARGENKYQPSRPILERRDYKSGRTNLHIVIIVTLFCDTMTEVIYGHCVSYWYPDSHKQLRTVLFYFLFRS
jgi:hypothetical protein